MSVSTIARVRQGRRIRPPQRDIAAAPSANPRKKQPTTRATEAASPPVKSVRRRVHNSSWLKAAEPLNSAMTEA